jgi:hypothetical protein
MPNFFVSITSQCHLVPLFLSMFADLSLYTVLARPKVRVLVTRPLNFAILNLGHRSHGDANFKISVCPGRSVG